VLFPKHKDNEIDPSANLGIALLCFGEYDNLVIFE